MKAVRVQRVNAEWETETIWSSLILGQYAMHLTS